VYTNPSVSRSDCSNPTCNSANPYSKGRCGPLYGCHIGFYPAPTGLKPNTADDIGLVNKRTDGNKTLVALPLCREKAAMQGLSGSIKAGAIATTGNLIQVVALQKDPTTFNSLKTLAAVSLKADVDSAATTNLIVTALLAGGDSAAASAWPSMSSDAKRQMIDTVALTMTEQEMVGMNLVPDDIRQKIYDMYFQHPDYATDNKMYCPAMPEFPVTENVPLNAMTGEIHSSHTHASQYGFKQCWQLWQEKDTLTKMFGAGALYTQATDDNETVASDWPAFHADGLSTGPAEWKRKVIFQEDGSMEYMGIAMFASSLGKGSDFVNLIKQVREQLSLDKVLVPENSDKDLFPTGTPFLFWEQYVDLMDHLLTKSTYAAVVVLCAVMLLIVLMSYSVASNGFPTLLLASVHGALLIVVVCVITMVEIYGFMGLLEIKLNAIPQVTLIMSVGITVEFTAHILLAFLHAPNPADLSDSWSFASRRARTLVALSKMFLPSLHGAVTTFLGILMLAFAKSEFVVLYYFTLYTMLVFFGIINGLLILPGLLTLCGPVAITSAGGHNKKTVIPSDCTVPPISSPAASAQPGKLQALDK